MARKRHHNVHVCFFVVCGFGKVFVFRGVFLVRVFVFVDLLGKGVFVIVVWCRFVVCVVLFCWCDLVCVVFVVVIVVLAVRLHVCACMLCETKQTSKQTNNNNTTTKS